jgi:uncharacterized membrane protein YphA (DoxX/SURF4 family)
MPILTTIFRTIVGLVFIYASIDKILSPQYFAGTILSYQILPEFLINLAAIILPWLELFCGILLVIGIWHRSAAWIVSALTFVFIFAIISVIFRGLDIECGCFGSGSSANWGRIVEDLFLLAFSLHVAFHPLSYLAIENLWNPAK